MAIKSAGGALPHPLYEALTALKTGQGDLAKVTHSVAVDVAIHRDAGNNHVHFLFTSRRYEGGNLTAKTLELDKKGTASKALRAIRKYWQDTCNYELEAAGFAERIDMRSYKDQDIDKLGQIHLGRDAWHHHARTGANDKAARNEARKALNLANEQLAKITRAP